MNKELEANKPVSIMYDHFMDQYKDEKKAVSAINQIGEQVKQDGCKLIHLGDTMFLVSVTAARMVEMHAMIGGHRTEEQKLSELDKQLEKLLPMLKDYGVKLAYTYMTPDKIGKFRKILKGHKFYERPAKSGGKSYIAVYVEV